VEPHATNEVGAWSDQPEIARELLEGGVVRRIDSNLQLDAGAALAKRQDANRPRHFDLVRV